MGLFEKIKNMVTEESDEYYDDEEMTFDDGFEDDGYFAKKTAKAEAPERKTATGLGGGIQVVIVKPERYEDAPSIGEHICAKKTVVLNLESASKETSKRLMDFISGVAFANKGLIKRVANSTFIITPSNVDVSGDLVLEELESGTLYL
ncbi:MAG: cell division protein SepF [Clostridia bacterium]|nr:cell division protein SepF [Clostridia bacterium]